MQDNLSSWVFGSQEMIRHAIIALVAGFVHALNNDNGRRELTMWGKVGEFVASMLIASFSGVIFGLLALYYFGSESYLTLAITGAGGFAGAKGLKIISESLVTAVRAAINRKA